LVALRVVIVITVSIADIIIVFIWYRKVRIFKVVLELEVHYLLVFIRKLRLQLTNIISDDKLLLLDLFYSFKYALFILTAPRIYDKL
jgi:hypothetical protein